VKEAEMKTALRMSVLPLFGAAFSTLAGLASGGCQSHYTTQEAYEACNDLLRLSIERDDREALADCVACYEDCGTDCDQVGTTPVTFSCPDD
jgi:hypothetical protein